MFRVILQKFVIILIYQFFVESTADILNLFKPQPDLPQQLNDFLIDVQQHKKDFAFIRTVAKNRRKYEKSYAENHNLFAEDLDNQLTLSPYYNKRLDSLDNRNQRPNMYDQNARSPELNQGNNIRSYYPNERYSKFIHSPVRLERELEANYLDTRVKLNPIGKYGEIKQAEPKFPGNRFANDENKYRADYMVEVEDKDDGDDYSELKPSNKKKREVEISIKSDGKLVKRIEEDENGPKSIILNIKAPNVEEKSQILDNPASKATKSGATTAVAGQSSQNNKNSDSGPSNSKSIPSLSNSDQNQNGGQNKNFGVPINSIPASNNAFSNNKNGPLKQSDESQSDLNSKNGKESVNQDKFVGLQKFNLPEVSKVSNSEDIKQKIDSYNSKSFGENSENSRWSGESNQMAKSIDIAQNNVNKFNGNKDRSNMDADLEEPKKESEFEKIQGVVVDDTNVNDLNNDEKIIFANKRESIKEKRWDQDQKDVDESNVPLDVQDIEANGAANGAFDYSIPLQQEANDLNNPNSDRELPESVHWKTGDGDIHLDPNEKYEVIEQSTKDILILPIVDSTTPCVIDVHVPNDDDNLDEQAKVEKAKMIGNAIAQEIKKDEKAEAEKEKGGSTECASGIPFPNHQEEKEEDEKEAEIEIIKHEDDKKDKNCRHDSNKEPSGGRKETEKLHNNPREYHHDNHIMNQNSRKEKRQIVKKKKSRKYVVKQKSNNGKKHSSGYESELDKKVPERAKRDQEKEGNWNDEAFRNRKHMPPVPRYKKKRVRQHPKKRVDRVEKEPSLVDYYDFNELYGPPDDTFDFIPSFYKRQLQSINYEYDPNVIHDFGDHDEEEIRKFEKAEDEKEKLKKLKTEEEKFQGHRKKFKSDGDYSDEEESNKETSKKIPKKKTRNQFASATEATTEDNDDDYNYEDLSDMPDEEEDVAYEEEKSDNMDVDETVGNNSQSDNENDRFHLDKLMMSYLAFPEFIPDRTLKRHTEKYLIIKAVTSHNDKKFLGDAHEYEDVIGGNEHEKASVSRGHGSAHKKAKKKKRKKQKKKPKRNDESDQNMKTENQDLAGDISSFHGRGNRGFKLVKHMQAKPKREDIEPVNQKKNNLATGELLNQFEQKPLSSQEKQDIFLRYNPEFQRWPRFVQNDNIYKDLMKKRALEHQQRYFRNARNMNRFPISNGYFLNPEQPVKREDPATEGTGTAAAASNAASEAASSGTEVASQSSTAESFAEQKEQASETTPNIETEPSHAPDNLNGATLPQAAKNILQTANSDIFENTTAPSLDEAANGNNSAAGAASVGQGLGSEQTQFKFTTTAEDLTENTLCMTPHKDMVSPCPDENASHVPVTVTSVLPLVPESVTLLKVNMTKAEYLDLNDIVGGVLPRHIVVHSLSNAKGNIRQGLNTGKFNMNINVSNYNSNMETRLILNEMTNLMLKLKYHTTCQALPPNLKTYVKLITKNEMDNPMSKLKEMEEIDFDEHQSSYVFHGGEGDSIQNKAQALKDLLNKYNTLPDNCKERAEPVREYIESHLAMIDNVSGNGNNNGKAKQSGGAVKPAENSSSALPKKEKKEINLGDSENSEEKNLNGQMMEEGLNNQHADANEAIEDRDKKSKRNVEDAKFPPVNPRELSTSTSPQYGKLAEAVRQLRNRRESEKRIGEIYGRAKREDEEKLENGEQSRKDKGFESPLVINF